MSNNKRIIPYLLVLAALGTGGTLMAMNGTDTVTMASTEKNTLLTADTVNAAFQGVGGKITSISVVEEQPVKKGDILMKLDTADIDLQIRKVRADMEQQDVRIKQAKEALQNGYAKISTQEEQARIGIAAAQASESLLNQGTRAEDLERQKLSLEAARQALDLATVNYERTKALFDSGAVSSAALDTASNQLQSTQNSVAQQQALLEKLQSGATSQERQQARLQTEKAKTSMTQTSQARLDLQNSAYNIDLLVAQKEAYAIQLQALELQKQRMVLPSPADGKVTRIVPKVGEIVAAGAPVVVVESDQLYYNLYVDESQIHHYQVNGQVVGRIVALNQDISGKVRYITSAPQYASMRMSREKGQSDVSSFLVRVDVPRSPSLLPGMTVEVNTGANHP